MSEDVHKHTTDATIDSFFRSCGRDQSHTCTLWFPDEKTRELFASWLCNSGEQSYWGYVKGQASGFQEKGGTFEETLERLNTTPRYWNLETGKFDPANIFCLSDEEWVAAQKMNNQKEIAVLFHNVSVEDREKVLGELGIAVLNGLTGHQDTVAFLKQKIEDLGDS